MSMQSHLTALAGLAALASTTVSFAAGPPRYRAEVHPPADGVPSVIPIGMGPDGAIYGYAGIEEFDPLAVAVRSTTDATTVLAEVLESHNRAYAADAAGNVYGMSGLAPARWGDGTSGLLPVPIGYFPGTAYGASSNGVICGILINDFAGFDIPVVWPDLDTEAILLPAPFGSGAAFDVNDAGVMTGIVQNASGRFVAVIWTDEESDPIELGMLPGGINSEGHAINERGDVAGRSAFEDSEVRPMLYLADTDERVDLGSLGGTYGEALALNEARDVVGHSNDGVEPHGFLWRDGTLHDLNALVVTSDASFDAVWRAVGIDDDGRIAAGVSTGTFPEIVYRAATLVPCGQGDVDCDDSVGVEDLLAVLAAWGPCTCIEDLDGDGAVGVGDLLEVLAAWTD